MAMLPTQIALFLLNLYCKRSLDMCQKAESTTVGVVLGHNVVFYHEKLMSEL